MLNFYKFKISVLLVLLNFFFPYLLHAANPIKKIFGQGMIAMSQKDYQKAIQAFEQLNKVYPGFAPSYHYLGLAHREAGHSRAKSLAAFHKAIKIDPKMAAALDQLAKIYYEKGDFSRAIDYGEQAIAIDGDLMTARLTVAWSYLASQTDLYQAVPHFEYVYQRDKSAHTCFGLGMVYYMTHQNFKAMELITELRLQSENDFASELERMIQSGPFKSESDMARQRSSDKKPIDQMAVVSQQPAPQALSSQSPKKDVPVYLDSRSTYGQSQNINKSGLSRIQQLQQQRQATQTGRKGW